MASAAFARHLSRMLNTRHHAETVVWVDGLTTYTTQGVFDVDGDMVDDGNGVAVPMTRRTLLVRAGALPGLSHNDAITVGGTAYTVHSPALPVEDGGLVQHIIAPTS